MQWQPNINGWIQGISRGHLQESPMLNGKIDDFPVDVPLDQFLEKMTMKNYQFDPI